MIVACTIIAGNYLAAARVLAESFYAYHPDGLFTALIVDDESRAITPTQGIDCRIAWWRLADLELAATEIHRLAGIYDVTELSTSVKPLFLQCLIRRHAAPVIYLDPDIRVHGSLAYASSLAETHGLVLTPHVTEPIPDDGRQVDALFVLAAGIYNLGFVAVGPVSPCLDWWWQQTRRRALNDTQAQMFTDQRWADYLPSLFPHHLLKDPGYNAAYWNLHERPVSRIDGRLYARNVVLRFMHFSGFDPSMPWVLSRHQGQRPRILLSEHPVLAALCEDYADVLMRAGQATLSQREYGWRVSTDGLEMTTRIRRLYWSAVMAAERGEIAEPPDPFDAVDPGAFTRWLNEPDELGPRHCSRYLQAIYRARPDVQAHMPDIHGVDAPRFADWVRSSGVVQERIPSSLMPPAPQPQSDTVPVTGEGADASPLPHGLNVVGYFEAKSGVGEAARLLTRAIDASGGAYTTIAQRAPVERHERPFEARVTEAPAPFDINLVCVNADMTPAFAREAGPAFFAGRYTIGYWFWEVEPLPAFMHVAFNDVDEVWTATDYVADIIRTASGGRKPVFTVPLPLLPGTASPALTREHLGLPADRFVFLFVFDFLSVLARKNPLAVIESFCASFAPGEGPLLVLKSINGDARMPQLEHLRRAAAFRSDVLIRDGWVSAAEKESLLAACDCYVSLHRAEGLGLTLAEAMGLGKPVIATGYSGNGHFMTGENSFLVDYTVTRPSSAHGPYPSDGRWAEPDVAHAARLMRQVYDHPHEAAEKGARAESDLRARHNLTRSASAIASRLACIRQARANAAAATLRPDDAPEPAVAPPPPTTEQITRLTEALEAFTATVPLLQQLGEPRLSYDSRPWQPLRRVAQRALFRIIRPYWFQERQFQNLLLTAIRTSLERAAMPEHKPPNGSG